VLFRADRVETPVDEAPYPDLPASPPKRPPDGRFCLRLTVQPEDAKRPPAALERTFLAVSSPVVRLHPGALVRITGWIRIPEPIQASPDGVLFFDSIGGEPLALRLVGPTPWRKFTLYRRVPASGQVSVTMALTGLGTAYFDDIRVEPLLPTHAPVQTTTARPPR
jgi:hypothetical protein